MLSNNTPYGGFLGGFIEASIEKPADGLNGDCIVHYSGEYSKYEMTVKLVNGIREGKALIVNEGIPYLLLEYKQGSLTGVMVRYNESGSVELRGHLVNGMESGLFEECDGSEKVVWRGYYRNGVRDSEVVESERLEGYYDEKSVESGLLLSIAQYDDSLHDKNGRCMEYENGDWVGEWMYENGVKRRPTREYRNGTLTIYDDKGTKTFEGQLSKEEVNDGFYGHQPMEGVYGFFKEVDSHGNVVSVAEYDALREKKNGRCFELEDGEVKRLCLYHMDRFIRVVQEFNGSTMIEYDENGRKVYEGEFNGDMENGFVRDGIGKEYRIVEKTRRSISSTCKSLLCCWMRKRGNELTTKTYPEEVIEGMWNNGSILILNPLTIKKLKIKNDCYNDSSVTELKLSGLIRLKRIVTGNNCFGKVRLFVLDGLSELESIVIGQWSYTYAKTDVDIQKSERTDGHTCIVNCPKLKSIQIGDSSFGDYYSFELNNLPALQYIDIGERCFYYSPSFSLTGLTGWVA